MLLFSLLFKYIYVKGCIKKILNIKSIVVYWEDGWVIIGRFGEGNKLNKYINKF